MLCMNHESGGGWEAGARGAGSWHAARGGERAREDPGLDAWLERNVRVCSRGEYLRYRAYLEAGHPPGPPCDE